VIAGLPGLLDAGWCLNGDGWAELVPERDYLTCHLWPMHQRAVTLSEKHEPKGVLRGGAVRAWSRSSASPPRTAG
jgi:hypothetical protein